MCEIINGIYNCKWAWRQPPFFSSLVKIRFSLHTRLHACLDSKVIIINRWGNFNICIVIPKHKSLSLRANRHYRCLDILFITNIHNFNIRIHHMHTLIYNIRYVTYFGNIKNNVIKMFKPWLVRWRCTNYFNLLFFCFVDLLSFCSICFKLASDFITRYSKNLHS
jgi:hypothetical protein